MTVRNVCLSTALLACLIGAGCTSIVKPYVNEADFFTSAAKMSGRADLYVSDAFCSHTETKIDVMDFKRWQFKLGGVAVDTFKYSLGSRFEKVDVKFGTPSFPISEADVEDLLVVVEPSFAGFKSHCPFLVKFETYVVKVSFRVKAYGQTGEVLLDKTYEGVGKKRGSIGTASAGLDANPVAAELAVKDAVNQAVADILQSVSK